MGWFLDLRIACTHEKNEVIEDGKRRKEAMTLFLSLKTPSLFTLYTVHNFNAQSNNKTTTSQGNRGLFVEATSEVKNNKHKLRGY